MIALLLLACAADAPDTGDSTEACAPAELRPVQELDVGDFLPTTPPQTGNLGLALGDRACLSLALARRIDAMTADRTWSKLRLGVGVQVVR